MARIKSSIVEKGSKAREEKPAKALSNSKLLWKDKLSLKNRIDDFLKKNGIKPIEDFKIQGESGSKYNFDFFIPKTKEVNFDSHKTFIENNLLTTEGLGIFIKDYQAPAKVTQVIQAEKVLKDCPKIGKILLVSNSFSGPSKTFADRTGVILLSIGEIVSLYKNQGWDI